MNGWRDWHSYSILVLSSGNWRHIQTHKLYHTWLSLLNVWSSHNISLLSRWYTSLIDQSHWHRRSQVVSKAARNKRTTTGGRWKTSAPAQLRPTTGRALFCSASYSLTLRRSTRPLVQPTQKSYNCTTITIYIWVSSEHTTISSLAWYLLLIFTFLVAPCCLFNQIDLSHTHSFQAGRASHWPPFLWKAITT